MKPRSSQPNVPVQRAAELQTILDAIHQGDIDAIVLPGVEGPHVYAIKDLQRQNAAFDDAQATAHIGSWEWDPAGDRAILSKEAQRIFGVQGPSALSWADVSSHIDVDDTVKVNSLLRGLLESPNDLPATISVCIQQGERKRHALVRGHVSKRTNQSKPALLAGIIEDTTAQVEAEATRTELERERLKVERLNEINRMRLEFLNNAAHDLNTPLTPLKLALGTFRRFSDLDEKELQMVAVMDRNVRRFEVLVQELLQAARLQNGRLKLNRTAVPLDVVIDEVQESFQGSATQAGLALTVSQEPGLIVDIDRDKVIQVLFNLVDNAIKYTQDGAIHIETRTSNGFAEISVTDTGVGLTPDQINRLFQPFVRVHEELGIAKGTGLGLYICKGIIEHHGGQIWAESAPKGKGSRFLVTLPLIG